MEHTWIRIEAWLAANAPRIVLNPPASREAIAEAEAFLGVQFPADVRETYLRHDGQKDGSPWMLEGWEWLSLENIKSQWSVWKDLLDGGEFDGIQNEGDGRCVRNDWWHRAWIPLTYSGAGDHHCLDLAPGRRGVSGQIIEMWHDDGARPVIAHSFVEWLADFADRLESGAFVASDEYCGLCLREDV